MAAILLTSNNLDFVKTSLRPALPRVKSSHLTEALATGAGYQTHASLLGAIKSAPLTILARIEDAAMAARLSEFGYNRYDLAGLGAIIRSPRLPDRIWAEFCSGDHGSNNSWFRECKRRNIPNIRIERRRKYVKLSWDCISIDPSSETHVRGETGSALMRDMFKTYQGIARRIPGKSEFFGSSFVGSVNRLLPELAHEIADTFFAMLYEPMCRQKLAG